MLDLACLSSYRMLYNACAFAQHVKFKRLTWCKLDKIIITAGKSLKGKQMALPAKF